MPLLHETHLATLSFALSGHILVLNHSAEDASATDWDTLLSFARPRVDEGAIAAILVGTKGGGPRAAQRKAMTEVYARHSVPVAVLSRSAFVRAISTAIRYFFKGTVRMFEPVELRAALLFLGVPDAQVEERAAAVRRFLQGAHAGSRAAS